MSTFVIVLTSVNNAFYDFKMEAVPPPQVWCKPKAESDLLDGYVAHQRSG
jgi:hypothetical protein